MRTAAGTMKSMRMAVGSIGQSAGSSPSATISVSWGERLGGSFKRYETAWVAALLLFIFAMSCSVSYHRPLWFDELFTLLLARQPSLHDFALAMPADGNPPLLALIVRVLVKFFGATQFAARLPSMVAFVAACAGLYVFVRRRCGMAAGLVAVGVVLYQPAWCYSFESRPYALVLAFTMLALLSWQRATEGGPRGLALSGIAAGLAGAMLSHHIGLVVVGFPLLVGEAYRWYERRKPDWRLYATSLVALPILAVTLPMAVRTRTQLLTLAYNQRPRLSVHVVLDWMRGVKFNLPTLLSASSLVILLVLIVATWRLGRRDSGSVVSIPGHEIAAAVGAALLIPVTLVLMMLSSNYYNCRYGIGCVLGFGMLTAFGLSRNLGHRRYLVAGVAAILFLGFLRDAKGRIALFDLNPQVPAVPAEYRDQPVATANVFVFFPAWFYGGAAEHARLHFLFDMPTALLDNNAVPEASLMLERGRLDAHLDDLKDFIAGNERFVAFIPGGTGTQIESRLRALGYTLTTIGDAGEHLFEAARNSRP